MKYSVYVSVDLSGRIEVEANSLIEAEQEATRIFDISDLDVNSIKANAEEC